MRSGTRLKHSHAVYVSFILEAGWRSYAESPKRPHRSNNLRVTTCQNPAIAVAKAISTEAKLNKKKREDSKHMIAAIWFMLVFQVISRVQVIKKHLILTIKTAFITLGHIY